MMGSALQNPGFSTILQHIVTMKSKNISKTLLETFQNNKFMLRYMQDMQQEIYQFQVTEFYVGMTFSECAEMLYLFGLEFSANEILYGKFVQDIPTDDRKMTLIAVETKD